MIDFIKRILFITLILPFGLLLSFEVFFKMIIFSTIWFFTGYFNEEALTNSFFGNIFIKITE